MQYFASQMLGLRAPNIQIQVQKPSEKETVKQAPTNIYPESSQNGDPKSTQNQKISKPGSQSVIPCAPRWPRIVPGSPKMQKWNHQACQITNLRPKIAISVPNLVEALGRKHLGANLLGGIKEEASGRGPQAQNYQEPQVSEQ